MFIEAHIKLDHLTNSYHAEDDIVSKIGDIFYNKKDYATARKLYELASKDENGIRDNGSPYAKLKLGYMFSQLVIPDYKQAMQYYIDAYRLGRMEAGNNIGCMYFYGQFVPEDHQRALHYFMEAAVNGNMYAQYNTGRFYKKGFGMPKDPLEALKWYTMSANQGFSFAKERVLWLNQKGHFLPQDKKDVKQPVTVQKKMTLYKQKGARHSVAGTLENQAMFIAQKVPDTNKASKEDPPLYFQVENN